MRKILAMLITGGFMIGQAFGQASLPTSFSGTWSNSFAPSGWTFTGLGTIYASDYDSSGGGAAKLDTTGDNVAIQYDSAATQVTYWVAGNSFAGGTFTVEESTDGSSWSALRTFSTLSTTAAKFTNAPASASRYIRFFYTAKVTGNVGLDGVSITGGVAVDPPTNVQFTAPSGSIGEAGGAYTVTVYKTLASGDISGQVALGGTAIAGADYTIGGTNFTLNGATTSATFVVSIVDDGDAESAETVILTLANVTGGTVATPSAFTLTISDNDSGGSGGLFISEVADPADDFNARFVEFFNASGSAIDLGAGNYYLSRQSNGGTTWGDIALTGSIGAGGVYVVAYSSTVYAAAYPSAPAPNQNSVQINGNGDDAYFLYVGGDHTAGTLVDIYGVLDQDGTGMAWEYLDGQAERNAGVTGPNTTWTASEWTITAGGTSIMTPGSHGGSTPEPTTNVLFTAASGSIGEAGGAFTVTVYKTQSDGDISGQVALGGTATESADYAISGTNFTLNGATTSATFVVTITNDGDTEDNETVTLTLANVTGGSVGSPSVFTLTITDDDAPPVVDEGIASFRFTSGPHLEPTAVSAGLAASVVSLTSGTIESNVTTGTYFPNMPYIEETGGWTAADQAAAKAFRFTLTPDANMSVTITAITFRAYATSAGPSAIGYDIGGLASYAVDAPSAALVTVSQTVSGVENQTAPILVQIQGWTNGSRASSGAGIFRLDDVVVFGTVTPVGDTAPVLAAIGNKITMSGVPVQFAVTATPTDGDTVELSVSNAPLSSTFGRTNEFGTFAWANPSPAGVYTMTFYAVDNDGADSETITITVTNPPAPPPSLNVWINELHYDNQGGDTNEGFEVAGPAGTDLSNFTLVLYNGSVSPAGGVYSNLAMSGTIDDESNGFGAVWFGFGGELNQVRNGPDAVALVYNGSQVIQFLSYEATFTATDGPAVGMTSESIGVQESGTTTPADWSLQLCGTGTSYVDYAWSTNLPHSRGDLNACQTIPGAGDPNDTDEDGLPNDWEFQYFGDTTSADPYGDDDNDGFFNIEEFVAGTIPVVVGGGSTSYFRGASFAVSNAAVSYASVTGRLYRLWSVTNLVLNSGWTQVGGPQAGSGAPQTLQDGSGVTAPVYRLSVEMETP